MIKFFVLFFHSRIAFSAAMAIALQCVPQVGFAAACLYRGTDATARVVNRSGEVFAPFPEAKSAQDCSRLKVASGTVSVYLINADRSAITQRQVGSEDGPLVPKAKGEQAAGGEDNPSLFTQVLVVLEGEQRLKAGSSRSTGADYVPAALPTGKIAQPDADLLIALGPVPDINLEKFECAVDGNAVHIQKGPAAALRIPSKRLKPGAKASWTLAYAGERYEGHFEVVTAASLAALSNTLSLESGSDADSTLSQLRIASGLVTAGFGWDARALIRAATHP